MHGDLPCLQLNIHTLAVTLDIESGLVEQVVVLVVVAPVLFVLVVQ